MCGGGGGASSFNALMSHHRNLPGNIGVAFPLTAADLLYLFGTACFERVSFFNALTSSMGICHGTQGLPFP